jgi:hypothetical protein
MPLPSRAIAWRFLLLAGCAGLALAQGLVLLGPEAMPLPALLGGGRAAPVPPLRPAEAPPERWAAILERPLFHPDRRPRPEPVPEPAAAAPAADPAPVAAVPAGLPAWSLLGTAIDGAKSSALVRSPALPHPVILRRGDTLEGWSVQAIGRGRVLLERDGLRFELTLPGAH